MEGGSLEQMMQHTHGCQDEGFLREVCHNVLKVSNDEKTSVWAIRI
jgi:hypothetical protein